MFAFWQIAFLLSVAIHNVSEARNLPAWVNKHRNGLPRMITATNPGFVRATFAVTLLCAVVTIAAILSGAGSLGLQVLCGFALIMCVNALIPHLALSLWLRDPMPGLVSGIGLVLPTGLVVLTKTYQKAALSSEQMFTTVPMIAIALLIGLPLLLRFTR